MEQEVLALSAIADGAFCVAFGREMRLIRLGRAWRGIILIWSGPSIGAAARAATFAKQSPPGKRAKLIYSDALENNDDCDGISLTTRFRATLRNVFEAPPEQELATGRKPGIGTCHVALAFTLGRLPTVEPKATKLKERNHQ